MTGVNSGQQYKKHSSFRHFKTFIDRRRLGELLVLKGFISPQDLRFALSKQRETKQPLGQIFLKHALITRRQLAIILARQICLRWAAAFMLFLASFSPFAVKKARADILDVPSRIMVSKSVKKTRFEKIAAYPGLFGTDEKRSTNLMPFTKWTGMFSRFDREISNGSSSHLIQEWQGRLADFENLPLKDMAARVNDLVNEKPYILDDRNWGQSDYWATPVEFLKKGGDCEDFAIAKYTALRALGVPEDRLRVAIVHDKQKNIPHAVLAVYTDNSVYILDNQIKTLVDANSNGRYRPIFSINRQAWWLHTSPDATLVASAD